MVSGNATDDSGYSSSTSALVLHVFSSSSTAVLLKIWLCCTMSLPDLMERAGIETVKQVMG